MEKGKPNEENEIVKALEDIHLENQNLQQCLKKIVTTRRLLDAKLDLVTSQLSSVVEENYNLEDGNLINCGKIEAVEKEANQLEESKTVLSDAIEKLKEEIKEYKENFKEKIDNFVQASDKLTAGFLFVVSNNEQVEEECLMKLTADLDKMKDENMEKENNVKKLKKELEEDDFYDFPEDPVELLVNTEERQFIMNMLENNLKNTRQQLENLYKLKTKKEIEESEV